MDTLISKVDTMTLKLDETLLRMSVVETQIDELSGRLINLEAKINDLNTVSQDCLIEIEEGIAQKNNLILFGLTENINFNDQTSDSKIIREMFAAVSSTVLQIFKK